MKTKFEAEIMILKAAIEKREKVAFRKILLKVLGKAQSYSTKRYYLKKAGGPCLSLAEKRSNFLSQGLENAKK